MLSERGIGIFNSDTFLFVHTNMPTD